MGLSENIISKSAASDLSFEEIKFFKDAGFDFEIKSVPWTETVQWFLKQKKVP
jgi:hypothetical protein